MSEQRDGGQDEPGAEVVPIRPPPAGTGAEVEPGHEQPAAATDGPQPAKVIYATAVYGPGERRDIIPVPFQRENLRGTIEQFADLNWHRARYHGLRLPLYVLACLVWALVGIVRAAGRVWRWWQLTEQHWLRNEAAADGDSKEWMRLHKEAKETRRVRSMILGAAAGVLLLTGLLLARFGPWWSWAAAAVAAAVVLARLGRPDGYRIISPAVVPPQYEPPNPEIITRALASLGIARITTALKDGGRIAFVSDVMRDGPGWGCQLDLPHGVTYGHIIAKRPELASGLRRPLSAVWPEGVPAEHEGRLSLWIGFHDISRQKPPRWPLAKAGVTDIFVGVPFGTDPRQRPVTVPLFEANWLIGASPGSGKTNVVRGIACGAALDTVVDLWIHEQAGKGDLEPLAQVCHRYVSGLDDEAVAYSADSARMLRGELERRSALFKKVPKDLRPDGKITRDLAMRHLRLRPILAIFDEAQVCFLHPEHGTQMAEDLPHVMRLARAYGIMIIIATQRPDKDSVPTAISGVVTCRFCLKVPDYLANDLVLGTGSYKAGYNAAIFRAITDAGMGWLKADGDPQIVRTYYLDLPATEKIAARARVMRERAGVLSGYALGLDDEDAAPRDVLADLLAVFGADSGMHWGAAADRLAERYPDRWADATAEAISAQCRSLGVRSVDVRMDGAVLKGCRRVAVEQARQ